MIFLYTRIISLVLPFAKASILGCLIIQGCTDSVTDEKLDSEKVSGKILIVTTTTQVTDIVRRLVGDFCQINPLMGPGVDPHLYKPTARDMTAITSADMVIYHGLKLEGKLAATLKNAHQIKTYAICSGIPKNHLIFSDGEESSYPDPHVWFSPEIWISCMHNIALHLATELPEYKKEIKQRALSLEIEYQEISMWAKSEVRSLPGNKRVLVTSHDAFRYFGDFFGVEVVALQGISTIQEAGLGDRANLVDFINENNISSVFVETSVNPKALEEIAKETGIAIGPPLFSDTLGSEEDKSLGPNETFYPHDTWSGMMVYNVKSFVKAMNQ
jgi:manganese/zinc/iron transport system substrate-binding protein